MQTSAQILETGTLEDGSIFKIVHFGREVQTIWNDGEISAYELKRGENPLQVAQWMVEAIYFAAETP